MTIINPYYQVPVSGSRQPLTGYKQLNWNKNTLNGKMATLKALYLRIEPFGECHENLSCM
jgi:hypothetical protein